MHSAFYLPQDPDYTILDSARDSVRFAHRCLEPTSAGAWRSIATFVDPAATPQPWHDFGNLEGPGWASNAIGGALLLYQWAGFDHCHLLQGVALGLADHVLDGGFIQPDGLVIGYRDTADDRLCLNFKHNSDWMCPGSMAQVALQMLRLADLLPADSTRRTRLVDTARNAAGWLIDRLAPLGDWYPRRCASDGRHYTQSAEGGNDPLFATSADGLAIIQLLMELTQRGMGDHSATVAAKLRHVVQSGGIYGSINHDTYDADENVARAITFRLMLRAAALLGDEKLRDFAYTNALAGMERFQMCEDRNGVATRGLLYMEDSWDTAYLWENAEAAEAYLDAYDDRGDEAHLCCAVTILRAIARHHHGEHGFLTEGVDWNNHVGQQHHIDQALYGAIRYTEPLLNNLHHVGPAVRLLSANIE